MKIPKRLWLLLAVSLALWFSGMAHTVVQGCETDTECECVDDCLSPP